MDRKIVVALVIILLALIAAARAQAAPFLICDPQAGVTHYRLQWEGFPEQVVPAQADGSLKYDLVSYSGNVPAQVWAGSEAVLDGVPQGVYNWSAPVPFLLELTKPQSPSGLGLSVN